MGAAAWYLPELTMESSAPSESLMDKQRDGLIQMLNFNKLAEESSGGIDEKWKVLIYDQFCRDVISPLLRVGDLRKQGVTLHLEIENNREEVGDVAAIYFVKPDEATVQRIAADVGRRLYDTFHLNFAQSTRLVLQHKQARIERQ